jgi:hypothetical protein
VRVIRYRQLIDAPRQTLDDLCAFLGIETGLLDTLPESNVGRWASDNPLNSLLRKGVRLGSAAGAYVDPRVWRTAERPLLNVMQRGAAPRPRLDPRDRVQLVERFTDDNALLGTLLGADYSDWLAPEGRGTYTVRRS